MKFTKLFTEERAVSPVIGVILMVAITVILAAVIGTFVLGLGDQAVDSDPQVAFKFSYDASDDGDASTHPSITVAHNGGDAIDASQVTIKSSDSVDGDGDDAFSSGDAWSGEGTFQAGDELSFTDTSLSSGDVIKLVYGDSVIGSYTVP